MKKFLYLLFLLSLSFGVTNYGLCDDTDEWSKALDVYNSDGLDRPVSAIEYRKVMKELDDLKNKNTKKKKYFWQKEEEQPMQKTPTTNEIKVERNDIIKVTTPLYYDGTTVPVGFYKITCTEENNDYYINFLQGKIPTAKIKATKVSHMDFCPDKVNCLESETYQDKYFKINFKTIDYAVQGYLTIIKN